ncbi:MAG: ribbon-helix-helix domain-containing protein [Candidatus Binataceae bacterium]
MRKREILTVSLPREMLKQVEQVRKAEHRTRSELVRETLRAYFALARSFPAEPATPSDVRALARARREYERGQTVTLARYLSGLHTRTRQPRAKAARSAPAR